jgi:TOTE conflict system, Archaeo-Eukaryotic Primase domain
MLSRAGQSRHRQTPGSPRCPERDRVARPLEDPSTVTGGLASRAELSHRKPGARLEGGGPAREARSRRPQVENEPVSAHIEVDAAIAVVEARLRELDGERETAARELAALRARRELPTSHAASNIPTGPVRFWTTERKLALFASLFRGRPDVFPRRWENRNKGKSGWAPCCENEWKTGVCGAPRIAWAGGHRQQSPRLRGRR